MGKNQDKNDDVPSKEELDHEIEVLRYELDKTNTSVAAIIIVGFIIVLLGFFWILHIDARVTDQDAFDQEWMKGIVSQDHRLDAVEKQLSPIPNCTNHTMKTAILLGNIDHFELKNASNTNIICQDGVDLNYVDKDDLLLTTTFPENPEAQFICMTERQVMNCSKTHEVS